MSEQLNYLNNLKKVTRSHEDYRGLMAIPGGICFAILGAKLLFATFDPGAATHPSLFDKTGNIYWDVASNIALLMLMALIPIHYWYNLKVGSVVADTETKQHRLFYGLAGAGLALGALALDYIPVAPVSIFGFIACIFWLWAMRFYRDLRAWFIFFALSQAAAFIAGPFIFADLKFNMLDYMRHIVGLCMLTGGILILVSGTVTHRSLMRQLHNPGNRTPDANHE